MKGGGSSVMTPPSDHGRALPGGQQRYVPWTSRCVGGGPAVEAMAVIEPLVAVSARTEIVAVESATVGADHVLSVTRSTITMLTLLPPASLTESSSPPSEMVPSKRN